MFEIYTNNIKNKEDQKVLRGSLIKRGDFLGIIETLFQCGMLSLKWSCLQKKTFSLKWKNNI